MDMEDLKLKHAELSFDSGGWLKIRKRNGEEISIHVEPEELITVGDWFTAASDHASAKTKTKRKDETR